jgi:hypothetical protein
MSKEISNIRWEFTDKPITPWGGLRLMKEFIDRTGIREQLRATWLPRPGSNRGYDPIAVLESFWVCVWIGGFRFAHTAMVRFDCALQQIFGWKRVPSVSTYTRFFRKFTQQRVDTTFNSVNRWFFGQIPPRTITLDLDSSVLTRYGTQEGCLVGYNPHKPGRPSHHPLMAFVADLRMVAHSWLRPGNAGTTNNAITFFAETREILGHHHIGLLRADAGFFDGNFLTVLEAQALSYIIAVRMNAVIKREIQSITSWLRLESGIEVGEFWYRAHPWKQARRIVVVRQLVEEHLQAAGKYLFDLRDYRYQAWVTNISLAEAEVWRLYRQRADSENRIEELKYDFGMNGFCLQEFYATEAAFRSVMLAYNLISLFRQVILKTKVQPRLQSIRFQCFAIGSWLGKKYRRPVLKLSLPVKRRPWFEGLFAKIVEFAPPFPLET